MKKEDQQLAPDGNGVPGDAEQRAPSATYPEQDATMDAHALPSGVRAHASVRGDQSEGVRDAESPADGGEPSALAPAGAAPDILADESAPARKRRRRRRRRKPNAMTNTASAPETATVTLPSAPNPEPHPSAKTERTDSDSNSRELSAKERTRAEAVLAFLRRYSVLLGTREDALPSLPERPSELWALEAWLGRDRLSHSLAAIDPHQRVSLIGEALQAAPKLATLRLLLEHLPKGGLERETPKLLDCLRRLDTSDADGAELRSFAEHLERMVSPACLVEWLLVASENKGLRRLFEAHQAELPSSWQELLEPTRILLAVLLRGQTNQWGARSLHRAVRTLLRSGASSLDARAPSTRLRLVELASHLVLEDEEERVVDRLLASSMSDPRAPELALDLAASYLAQRRAKKAATRLLAIEAAAPGKTPAGKWLRALDALRYGDVALLKSRVNPPIANDCELRPGFSLTEQFDVWLRIGEDTQGAAFQEHAEVHRRAEIPCVTPLRYFGLTGMRRPYAAFPRVGENAKTVLATPRGLTRRQSARFARQLLQLAYGLARAGVTLPDADFGRLEVASDGQLWLVETWGSKLATFEVARDAMLAIAKQWLSALLSDSPSFDFTEEQQENLLHAADFATLRALLDSVGGVYVWRE